MATHQITLVVRPLSEIAAEIRRDWKKPYFGAVPYIDALGQMNSIRDKFGFDSGEGVVAYFLANANAWRGEVARRVKAELNAMLKALRK